MLQADPAQRISMDDVVKELESLKLSNNLQIELIIVDTGSDTRHVQSKTNRESKTFNVVTEEIYSMATLFSKYFVPKQPHNQKEANLCWSIAVISLLRSELIVIIIIHRNDDHYL